MCYIIRHWQQDPELKTIRRYIFTCFRYLMPLSLIISSYIMSRETEHITRCLLIFHAHSENNNTLMSTEFHCRFHVTLFRRERDVGPNCSRCVECEKGGGWLGCHLTHRRRLLNQRWFVILLPGQTQQGGLLGGRRVVQDAWQSPDYKQGSYRALLADKSAGR